MGKITDGFAALMDDCATDFSEFHRQVEGIRHRIWRVAIYFATTRVWPFRRAREQIQVKSAGLSAPSHQRRNHHPVDIHEPAITLAEPQKIGALVSSPLIEGDEERISVADLSRIESHLEERFQLPRIEP